MAIVDIVRELFKKENIIKLLKQKNQKNET